MYRNTAKGDKSDLKVFTSLFKGSICKGKNLLPVGANSFLYKYPPKKGANFFSFIPLQEGLHIPDSRNEILFH